MGDSLYYPGMEKHKEKTISLQTVGCRLNQYETEKMAAELYPFGFRRAEKGEPADLTIINTCTVTHRADSDCRYLIRRAARQNPNGRIVVVGCYVDHEPERIAGMEAVDVIVRNSEKNDIATILPRKLPDLFDHEPDKSCSTAIADFHDRNRAWLKISDGCNQWCSFCIITIVRGRLTNRPARELIDEINSLVVHGYRELVLTGVNMGYYHDKAHEPKVKNLAELCKMIMRETDLYRMRLSSIEPQAITEEFVAMYADSGGRICRHFHLPLQSASSRILRQMRRPYNQAMYIKRVTDLKNAVPDTIVGADVIVGFPGETEEDFSRTRRLCESGLIDYLHVFSYSDRPGTDAATMPNKINPEVIRKRNTILTRISNHWRTESHYRQIGKTLEVISEMKSNVDGSHYAISDNYLRVKLPPEIDSGKEIVKIQVTAANEKYLEGNSIT